jgi:hypothetical protein
VIPNPVDRLPKKHTAHLRPTPEASEDERSFTRIRYHESRCSRCSIRRSTGYLSTSNALT